MRRREVGLLPITFSVKVIDQNQTRQCMRRRQVGLLPITFFQRESN